MKDEEPDWQDRAAAIFVRLSSWTIIALILVALWFGAKLVALWFGSAFPALKGALPEMDPIWESTQGTNILLAMILFVLWTKR